MDDVQNSIGNTPQESSPAPITLSTSVDQSAAAAAAFPARNSNGSADASKLANSCVEGSGMQAAAEDLGLPVVAGESSLTMKEKKGTLKSSNRAMLPKSISSSVLETKRNDASASTARVAQLHQPLDNENLDDHDRRLTLSPEAKYGSNRSTDPAKLANIDTAAPFESVKVAVSKFGGIVDWKSHRAQTMEKRKVIEQELGRVHEEIPLYKKRSKDAEEAKLLVLEELESTKRLVEELKVNLDWAQKEEEQAKQDSELAELRVAEMEQGIAEDASTVAKAQIEVARVRHEAAVSELRAIKDELEQLKKDYAVLVTEKDESMKEREIAISRSNEIEKSVEDLTVELITVKESLESAHAAHLEAEEHRVGAVMAKEQDILSWEEELKQAEQELDRATQRLLASKDLKSKLDTATALLEDLKAELAAYVDSKAEQGSAEEGNFQDAVKEPRKGTQRNVEAALSAAKKELEQVNINIEKSTDEVNILTVAATSLKSELEKEKAELAAIQQREGMAAIAVASLEDELSRTETEISFAQVQEKEQTEKLMELPKQLQAVAPEADQAKELVKIASDELRKAKEEAVQAKAGASTMDSRLRAVQKEIEAAKASEKLALAATNALVETEYVQKNNSGNSPATVTLSLEEYYELSKRAQEAEEQANTRVTAVLSEIEVAKESELESVHKLEEANREMAERKEALQYALQKSEKAEEEKLGVEQELRKWRAENEQRRKAGERLSTTKNSNISSKAGFKERLGSKNPVNAPDSSAVKLKSIPHPSMSSTDTDEQPQPQVTKKKKKFIFPKIFMFLSKKKAQSSKS